MKYWIFAGRPQTAAADRLADELRAEGHFVVCASTRFYRGERYPDADVILHDGSDARLEAVHPDKEVRRFDSPAPAKPEPLGEYHVTKAGAWYKLVGPDGEQVGKSQRSEADAWALLD